MLYGWNLLAVSINLLTTVVATNAKGCKEDKNPPKVLGFLSNSVVSSVLCLGKKRSDSVSKLQTT